MANVAALALSAELAGELTAVGEALRRSTVQVRTRGWSGGGSGVIWRPDGLIVSNAHVARGREATVELWDGRTLPARVAARDPGRDLAALRIEATELPAAIPAEDRALRAGDLVLALGNPLGWTGALSLGVVHAVERTRPGGAPRWIRADVRLAPGNSGGPLADARGRVVGINTMIARGLAMAVPVTAVTRFLRSPEAPRRLGVTARAVMLRIGDEGRLGLLVLEVERGSLAAEVGVLPGDVILGLGDLPLETPGDLAAGMAGAADGEVLRLELIRGGRRITREAVIPGGEAAKAA